ncbi:MAG: thioredoxin family protein [Thermoguttaceae bacterium]
MARTWKIAVVAGLLAAIGVLWAATAGQAAKLKIGDPAPDWKELVGVDDQKHSLADYKDAKLIVLVFTCNHCPVAQAYEDRLIAVQEDYQAKGVQVVAINPNSPRVQPQDSFDKMKERAAGKGLGGWRQDKRPFNFPYLLDAAQTVVRDYGGTCTPHVFVLDKDRRVVYMGAVDDNNNPKRVEKHFLRDALDALLAGQQPPVAVTQERGCSIKWDVKPGVAKPKKKRQKAA